MYLFRVNMAAIGSVEEMVDDISGLSFVFSGSWYGTTRSVVSALVLLGGSAYAASRCVGLRGAEHRDGVSAYSGPVGACLW